MMITIRNKKAFTFVELMVYVALVSIISAAIFKIFTTNTNIYQYQENLAEMFQELRAAMDMISREIRMAGCDPTNARNLSGIPIGISNADATSINFTRDITDDSGAGDPDGDTNDPNENITYLLYGESGGIYKLGRSTGANPQPVAENIVHLDFKYFDAAGNDLGAGPNVALIRSIEITLTAQTAALDPISGDKQQRTLSSRVQIRNAGL